MIIYKIFGRFEYKSDTEPCHFIQRNFTINGFGYRGGTESGISHSYEKITTLTDNRGTRVSFIFKSIIFTVHFAHQT